MKEKKILNGKSRQILTALHKKGNEMTANEIAKETGFSYKTVTKYIEELANLGIIKKGVESDAKTN